MSESKNYFKTEEKFDREIKFKDDKIAFSRKWKVKDRRKLKELLIEKGESITPIDIAGVLVFPCLKDSNILLTEEELKYALTEIRAHSISEDFTFKFICSNESCREENEQVIRISEINKAKYLPWSPVNIDGVEIEFGELCTPKFYYDKLYDAKTPEERFIIDLALHIVRVDTFEGVIKFEDMIAEFDNMDTEFQDEIIKEYKKQRFSQDNIKECTCSKCGTTQAFMFDEIPDFFPPSWTE